MKQIINIYKNWKKKKQKTKSKQNSSFERYMQRCKDENCFKHCKPEQLILSGKYTKLLKAFAIAYGLKHSIEWSETNFGLGLEVEVFVETKQFQSGLDVFEHGKIAYVSEMRKYTQDAQEDTVESFSKQIIEGLCKENRYMKSFKGGDGYLICNDHLEFCEQYTCECPHSHEELMMKIDLAGIDVDKIEVELKKSRH